MALYISHASREDVVTLAGLMEEGEVTPFVDRQYRLAEIADAMRYLEEGHARGKVVITMD